MFDYFRNCLSNPHHVCCQDNPTEGRQNLCQPDVLVLHPRSKLRLKRDTFLICYLTVIISDNISAVEFKLVIMIDLYAYQLMTYQLQYICLLVSIQRMRLTSQQHSVLLGTGRVSTFCNNKYIREEQDISVTVRCMQMSVCWFEHKVRRNSTLIK